MQNNTIECPIRVLEQLVEDIEKDNWVNEDAQKLVKNGVILAVGRLEKHGFIRVTEDELAINPLPKVDPKRLGIPFEL